MNLIYLYNIRYMKISDSIKFVIIFNCQNYVKKEIF